MTPESHCVPTRRKRLGCVLWLTLKDWVLSFSGAEALDRQCHPRYGKVVFRNDRYGYRLPGTPQPLTTPA